jgi:hypothetical protein
MTIASNYDFHLETLMRDAENIFDCKAYDAVLRAAKVLFGDRNVTYNESTIFIKDKITLELSLSWNEQKVYIYTYFDLDLMKGDKLENASDVNNELRRLNGTFRLFGLNEIIQYLQIKEIENRFIKQHEG